MGAYTDACMQKETDRHIQTYTQTPKHTFSHTQDWESKKVEQ